MKPFCAVSVIVWVPATLTVVLTVIGVKGAMAKSMTWKAMLDVEWESAPLVPVTVTV